MGLGSARMSQGRRRWHASSSMLQRQRQREREKKKRERVRERGSGTSTDCFRCLLGWLSDSRPLHCLALAFRVAHHTASSQHDVRGCSRALYTGTGPGGHVHRDMASIIWCMRCPSRVKTTTHPLPPPVGTHSGGCVDDDIERTVE